MLCSIFARSKNSRSAIIISDSNNATEKLNIQVIICGRDGRIVKIVGKNKIGKIFCELSKKQNKTKQNKNPMTLRHSMCSAHFCPMPFIYLSDLITRLSFCVNDLQVVPTNSRNFVFLDNSKTVENNEKRKKHRVDYTFTNQ